jgi:hypothetical protein
MTENKNIKYKLETLASYWPEDLDYPQFEVAYEIESGEESFGTVCCIDLAEQALKRITELEDLLMLAHKDIGFYKCCALSGEVPKDGSQPSRKLLKQSDE